LLLSVRVLRSLVPTGRRTLRCGHRGGGESVPVLYRVCVRGVGEALGLRLLEWGNLQRDRLHGGGDRSTVEVERALLGVRDAVPVLVDEQVDGCQRL
jgi:hypothetical protein